ncbi:MAG TPA: peptidoglycan DD-metalloendopeptidase family protein [Pseudolabrys sp.]|nr:peptidoglycan DD-metalloendopeptidase family protein [Pseudolabrys sp.]
MSVSVHFSSRAWPRVAILALIAVAAAGCADSARFGPERSAYYQPPKNIPNSSEVTGSIARQPSHSRVVSQPLPAPTRPATVAAYGGGVASGAHGLGAYRPQAHDNVTGSVPSHQSPAPAPKTAGHWSWHGGKAVALARGETLASISRRYNVPLSAIMQVNNIRDARDLAVGQRIIVPRWVSGGEPRVAAAAPQYAPRAPEPHVARHRGGSHVYVAQRGDTLISIARRHGMSLAALAKYNHISPFTKLEVGARVNVPGGADQVASAAPRQDVRHESRYEPRQEARYEPSHAAAPEPHIARPRTETVASTQPAPTARVARPETEPTRTASRDVTKSAEPAGGIPQFRWPVKGRIIARFGREPNGTTNDGINLAVPEGTPIKAADDGVVAYAGNELKGYGNLVLIRHADGYVSAYANASKLLVSRGEHVRRGQVIARAGQTGNVTSPQLHFEIRKGSMPVDPTKYLGS